MKFLLLFALFSTLLFVPAWWIQHPYQGVLAAAAAKIIAPGSEIEFVDLELFYPFDIGIYIALCLASLWLPWKTRARALVIGIPIMIAIELISVVGAMGAVFGVMSKPGVAQNKADEMIRLSTAIIRVAGLVAAAGVWYFQLGRQRLSLAARAWLGADAAPRT